MDGIFRKAALLAVLACLQECAMCLSGLEAWGLVLIPQAATSLLNPKVSI